MVVTNRFSLRKLFLQVFKSGKLERMFEYACAFPSLLISVADPDVFGLPGSVGRTYGSDSGSGSFYHQAKIVRKTLIPTVF